MEPISSIALSLALGAGAVACKEVVNGLVKDGYAALKALQGNRISEQSQKAGEIGLIPARSLELAS